MERIAINKAVVGGLKQAIKAHGPITSALMGSAAKRIIGSIEKIKQKQKDSSEIEILKKSDKR